MIILKARLYNVLKFHGMEDNRSYRDNSTCEAVAG